MYICDSPLTLYQPISAEYAQSQTHLEVKRCDFSPGNQTKPTKAMQSNLCSVLVLFAQVKSEYAQLKDTLGAVTQERDLALWERNQLQGKLENLEQVLKVRKAAPWLRVYILPNSRDH